MRKTLAEFQTILKNNLQGRVKEIHSELETSLGWEAVAQEAQHYTLVGSFFFDFSSGEQPFLTVVRGYENMHSFQPFDSSFYSKYFDAFKKIVTRLPEVQKSRTPFYTAALESGGIPVNLTSASLSYLPSTAGAVYRLPGFTLRNVPGAYAKDELPGKYDYDLSGLYSNLFTFLREMASAEELSMFSMIPDSPSLDRYLNYCYKGGKYYGRQYYTLAQDGREMDAPAGGAIVYLGHNEYLRSIPVAGFSSAALGIANSMGYVRMPALTVGGIASWQVTSPRPMNSGAVMFDAFGAISHMTSSASNGYYKLFRCRGGAIPAYGAPLTTDFAGPLNVNSAQTDNPFRQVRAFASAATANAYVYAEADSRAKIYVKDETFLLNIPHSEGMLPGISLTAQTLKNLNVRRQGLQDTLLLNQERINSLHRRNIFNAAVEQHHDNAKQYRKEAESARAKHHLLSARACELFGQTLAIRAYRPLRLSIDDMIRSVLVLLILTLPFSFALERLLICATNIYRQLGTTFFIACATFLILYFTHPAFMLAQTPVIIFIAFFIILMSLAVIYIVMKRFQKEVAALQGLNSSAHKMQSGGSLLTALIVGVSSMRNRPVKTFLTILTVILLTFTIISFASFTSSGTVRKVYFSDSASEDRIEIFLGNHMMHSDEAMQSIRELYQKDYEIFFRTGSSVEPSGMLDTWARQINYIYNPEKRLFSRIDSLSGFDPGEKQCSAALRKLVPALNAPEKYSDGMPRIFLPRTLADHLELKVGDLCHVRSIPFKVGGIFEPSELDDFTFLDNGKVSGPNFADTVTMQTSLTDSVTDPGMTDNTHFIWNSPDMTLITDNSTVRRFNAGIHAAVLYPRKGARTDQNADAVRLAETVYGMVYASGVDGVYKYFYGDSRSASGWGEILVPLLLGALIIFSSLLGSIADREKEIFTFSALGLSPFDVGLLFFAESAVYAVVGALGGFLLSQATMSLLTQFASRGWILAPEMNYSSMSTIYALLLVMAVVMLSTIYPAIKASSSATPDVARQWKMPPVREGRLQFQFPFTVSSLDFGAILVFIGEFFRNHEDSSLGSFVSSSVAVACRAGTGKTGTRLDAQISLAPFDLGVSESFSMYATHSEIEGIDVVCVEIIRKSGSERNFVRANRRFVNEMRNQFLVWRSLPPETVAHYRRLAEYWTSEDLARRHA